MSEKRPHRTTVVSRAQEEQPAANARQALGALENVLTIARGHLRDRVIESGRSSKRGAEAAIVGVSPVAPPRISSLLFEQRQMAVHALARLATDVEVAREVLAWADRRADRLSRRLADALVAEMIVSVRHGILLSPGEIVTLIDLDVGDDEIEKTIARPVLVAWARAAGGSDALQNLAESSLDGEGAPAGGRDDDAAAGKRRARLVEAGTSNDARGDSIRTAIATWGAAGAFELGGGKKNESLGWLGAANALEEIGRLSPSIGGAAIDLFATMTLLRAHGALAQTAERLEALARGQAIAVVLLAEPNVPGIGAPRTCAETLDAGGYALFGDKTARLVEGAAEVVIALVRTDMTRAGSAGSSLLLTSIASGATGVTIDAEGSLVFDGFEVADGAALGGEAGHAALQLDTALGAGWFATAAVSLGAAQAALEIAVTAARERLSGTAPLLRKPRVAARLGRAIVATAGARRMVAAAARVQETEARFTAAAIARLASARAAELTIALAGDFAALLGRRPPALLATLADAARGDAAYGSEDDTAEALARRLLA